MTGKKRKKKRSSAGLLLAAVVLLAVACAMPAVYAVQYYKTNYTLELAGDAEMTVGLCGIYEEPGASALVRGEDASDQVTVSGSVDTETPGTYELTYTIGKLTATRTVTVSETMDPILELEGDGKLTVKLGEEFQDPGYSARDDDGTDLTKTVQVDTADLNRAGEHQLTYTAEDADGNRTKLTRQVTVEPNTDYETPGLPICMFHYVYDENDPPEDLHKRYGNYISAQALEEELNWLNEEGYYFPTWDEVRDYIDGKLLLPEKSVVLTFDDAEMSFLKVGIPVLEKCRVPATSFVITKNKGEKKVKKYASEYVSFQSHSDNMHRTGGSIGHGGIFTAMPREEAIADLEKSIAIVGNRDAFAYPYGDYNDYCEEILKEVGFKCAVTTQPGKARPGMDPLLLPRQRMVLDQTLTRFQNLVRP